jgi:hypothetical protein
MPENFIVVGGLARIAAGVFGLGSPVSGQVMETPSQDGVKPGGPYHYAQGALFTPQTGNWYLRPSYDGPIQPIWGHAFLRWPNLFTPIQKPQVYTAASTYLYGVGGQVAGQLINQPLSEIQQLGGGE